MCRQHWTSLTPVLRKAINDDYTDGQDKAGNGVRPTPEWFTAALLSDAASSLIQTAVIFTFIVSSYWIVLRYPTPIATDEKLRRD